MGQKVHPFGLRLGYNKTWRSRWYAKKDYGTLLHEDLRLKKELKKQLGHAGVSNIEIERPGNKIRVTIYTSRPGIIIGRKGSEIDKLKVDLQQRTNREVSSTSMRFIARNWRHNWLPNPLRFSCKRGLRFGGRCGRPSTRPSKSTPRASGSVARGV